MVKTRKPKIGGILVIISGVLGLLGAINYSVGFGNISGLGRGDIPPFIPSIVLGMSIPSIIIAIIALVGGIFAVQRKRWRWALAGSISAVLSFLLLGLPAIILIALSRDEFT